MAYLLLYIDDILVTSSERDCIITHLQIELPICDLEPFNYLSGITVTRTPFMFLFPHKYAQKILERVGMHTGKDATQVQVRRFMIVLSTET